MDIPGLIFLVAFLGTAVVLTIAINWGLTSPPQRTPEQLDQDAARLRALGRHAEATADYNEKRTKMKLKEEELREVEDFLAQQRAKRNSPRSK